MANDTTDVINIKITADAKEATSAVESLVKTLDKIKGAANGKNKSLDAISKTIGAIGKAAKSTDDQVAKVERLTEAIARLNNVKLSASVANQIAKIGSALNSIDLGDVGKLETLSNSVEKINANGGLGNIRVERPRATVTEEAAVPIVETQNVSEAITEFNALEDVIESVREEAAVPIVANIDVRTTITDARKQFEEFGRELENNFDFSGGGVDYEGAFGSLATVAKKVADGFKRAATSAKNFLHSITRIAMYRAIRSALKAITQGFKEGLQNAYQFSKLNGGQLAKSLDSIATSTQYLKNSLATLAAPLINSFAPAIKYVIGLLVKFINMINYGVAVFTGKDTWLKAKEAPAEYAAATNSATEANKKFKASLLGIDEINALNDNSASGGGVGGSGTNYGDMFEEVPTFESNATQDVIDDIKNRVAKLTEYLSVAALAVGAILTFTGANIPLGVALMAAGAVGLVKSLELDWETTNNKVDTVVNAITAIVGGALLAIGGVLAFSGANVPLGVALMAAGAVTLGTAIALHWGGISDNVKEVISDIALAVGAAGAVIGAILTFTGANIPLGIGLMVAGLAMSASAVAVNWDTIKEKMQGSMGLVAAVVSAGTMVVGAVLAFTGVNLPLGIGLMAVGAAGLGTVVTLNWDTIKEKLQGSFGAVVAAISGGLLVIGAVLAFTGVNLPLGIGLMAAGAVGLGTVVTLNWETIKEKLQGSFGLVVAAISGALLVIGAVLAFTGAALPLGIGLMAAGAVGLGTTAVLNWDTIKEKMQGPIGAITAIVSSALLVVGAILLFTGAGIPLGLGLMAAGAVGLGTAISANWDTITGAISTAFEKINGFFSSIMQPIIDAWNNWKEDKKELIAELKAKIGEKWEELKAAWENFKEETKAKIAEYKAKLGEKWEELKTAWNNFTEETKSKIAEYKAKIGEKWEEMKTAWANFTEETKSKIAEYKAKIGEKWQEMKDAWTNIKTETKDLTANLIAKLGTAADTVKGWWKKILNWFRGGTDDEAETEDRKFSIGAKLGDIANTVKGWWSTIVNWFRGGTEGQKVKENRKLPIGARNTTKKEDTKSWWTRIKEKLWKTKNLPVGASQKTKKEDTKTWWQNLLTLWGDKSLPASCTVTKISVTKAAEDAWLKKSQDLGLDPKYTNSYFSSTGMGPGNAASTKGVKGQANGGFVTTGELFIAREAGPEMVGTIGRTTAVANNDQIVAGISSGVYAANQEQNALLRQQNALLAQLLEKDSGGGGQVTVSSIVTGVDRYNRRAGKTVMATA